MLKTKKLSTITAVFWFLLLYIVAALVWWYISLHHQNEKMSELLINELKHDEPGYVIKVAGIEEERKRKNGQYISEGITFFVVILIGAVFVFRAARRKLRLSQQQQNFMMTVTHELKTPLSVARLNLETILKRSLSDEQQKKLLTTTLQEVNRLNTLSNNILLASRFDAGEYKSVKSQVNISVIVHKLYEDFKSRYPDRSLTDNIIDEIIIKGEELLLELLCSNLIDNACKYSPKKSAIKISLIKEGSDVAFIVEDEGLGIEEKEKNRIFEKFYRIGNEETRTAKGTGLGLYLCRQIAKDHNATIDVKPNKPVGSIFTVTFRT